MVGRKKKWTDRSQRILETAAQLFRHYGFEKTSLEDIAKGAGISKGSIYLEFNSKDDILLGVIEQSSFQEIDKMKAVASQTHENICETLHQMIIDHILHVYD
ncbi:MAG: TetR/AcrR family transcriptional regulator, partial [Cyanobacteria bacterium]|nr:TetR/AcrR family transcriptional regulator [Cyanobacteriota bacterium]